jgi:uncharacterized protein YecE (DUF72 family)
MSSSERIFIGTSGYSYKGWHKRFYPADLGQRNLLPFYAGIFNAVEINNSFYMLPKPNAVKRWMEETPRGFRFCMKVSRFITHNKKLLEPEANVPKFLAAIMHIAPQRGPLLLQLPPNLKPHYERLDATLAAFRKSGGGRWQVALECRDARWYSQELNAVLDRHKAGLVLHDKPGSAMLDLNEKAPFAYMRYHGPTGDYGGEYGRKGLKKTAGLLREHLADGKKIYAFFNNDRDGYAPEDAQKLRELLADR